MLPPPPSPVKKPIFGRSLRVPRDAAVTMLRNNVGGLGGILIFNWFFPIYPRVKSVILPEAWSEMWSTIELCVLSLVFGVNILVALVSLQYPKAPYPPLRTPTKPVVQTTPVRRPIKGLGTSPMLRLSAAKSFTSSGYASTPFSTSSRMFSYSVPSSAGTPLNQSTASSLSASSSFNSSPLAAYLGRHSVKPGRPIDTELLDSLTANGTEQF